MLVDKLLALGLVGDLGLEFGDASGALAGGFLELVALGGEGVLFGDEGRESGRERIALSNE